MWILSTLRSIYDPPGLEAPFLMKQQLIVQQLSSSMNWDEIIDDSLYEWAKVEK